jgi:CDP-paratose 2-epimerase
MERHTLITGGAGFIGSNYAARLLQRHEKVTILDNLTRAGAANNLQWLEETFGKNAYDLIIGDVRNEEVVNRAVKTADVVVHLAAQVAVTTSVIDPRTDFEINALGTFNVLEAARQSGRNPFFIYASTNKVYGGMDDIAVVEKPTRYEYADLPFGASENQPLDFHSPYGCSKGCGDQYVRDYYRMYGLPTVVFRQSCIYGTRQFGIEDQGWMAWFMIAAHSGTLITICGDGKQVRDILFVDDLLDAYDAARENSDRVAGQVFNIGGGAENTLSIWQEFAPMLHKLIGKTIPVVWGDWRPGDQKVYVSDIRKAEIDLGWKPQISLQEGIERLYHWIQSNPHFNHLG